MKRKALLLGVAMALAGPCAIAQAAQPANGSGVQAGAIDQEAIQALKTMGAYLLSLQRFQVSTELSGERVLADGQKLQHTAAARLDVSRPNKIKASISSARSEREILYDGKVVTIYAPSQKYYSSIAMVDTLGGLIQQLENRYGIELPLADLFAWGTSNAPTGTIDSAMNAGQDIVDGDVCEHYAFRQGKIDWQIWIAAGSRPLPRKLVITDRSDEARPQSVSTIRWTTSPRFSDSVFTFAAPKGARQIEAVPLTNQ
ncbi:DUF2092 domain-containing protein [Cupriavidus numazuensis]|uniref:DUF2092 domain-containing protein n=1 Tax=Cupriavidus numazuensis TaxID=221992 RepID=A0ABM8TTP0_9BURK|nr:DUF2092 domain-containing protein [Cupriavidus numazuensis]CAG2159841.1 hypothetical protein LMG26411_07022 [Cupriavidus numazuensis]